MPNRTSKDYVPAADSANNVAMSDAVGNKTDAAVGAATTDKSLMGYVKGIVTDTAVIGALGAGLTALSTQTSVDTVDGYHDVPTKDAGTDTVMRDVVGRKTDTAAADAVSEVESLMAYAKQNVTNTEALGTTSEKIVEIATPTALPQTASLVLFTVTGLVQIIEIRAFITQQVGAVANATKFTGGAGTVDLCATVELNAAAANSLLSITGTFVNPMIINAGGAYESQANPITVGQGSISIECAGSDGGGGGNGLLTYTLVYKPVSSDGSVVAA